MAKQRAYVAKADTGLQWGPIVARILLPTSRQRDVMAVESSRGTQVASRSSAGRSLTRELEVPR